MLKLLPAMSVMAVGTAAAASGRLGDIFAIWIVMIVGFASAGALLRHERRTRRTQAAKV
ncbi:hypothetical protein [Phenylobacterium sp.]|uniref:hypothetical protein n=1 Tax=Phenylobacterium sp. TaxID=1871053 RepID=UPI00289A4254|nr:hypothetical protein [Phenylobacterium sp.]